MNGIASTSFSLPSHGLDDGRSPATLTACHPLDGSSVSRATLSPLSLALHRAYARRMHGICVAASKSHECGEPNSKPAFSVLHMGIVEGRSPASLTSATPWAAVRDRARLFSRTHQGCEKLEPSRKIGADLSSEAAGVRREVMRHPLAEGTVKGIGAKGFQNEAPLGRAPGGEANDASRERTSPSPAQRHGDPGGCWQCARWLCRSASDAARPTEDKSVWRCR